MTDRPNHLHLIDIDAIERRLRDDRPVHIEITTPSRFASLAADFRDVLSEVRGSPYSHALIAILTVIAWTAILVAPLMIGGAK